MAAGFDFNKFLEELNEKYKDQPLIKNLSEQSKQKPAFIVLGLVGVAVFLLLVIFGIETLSNVVLILPIYASFKAIKSKGKDDDTMWLTYWVLVSSVLVVESVVEELFLDDDDEQTYSMWLMGFLYFVARIGFFYWAAQQKGAQIIYEKALLPAFNKIEEAVEGKKA